MLYFFSSANASVSLSVYVTASPHLSVTFALRLRSEGMHQEQRDAETEGKAFKYDTVITITPLKGLYFILLQSNHLVHIVFSLLNDQLKHFNK